MSFFRSESMSLYQIIFQIEYTYDYIATLGDAGCVKFREKPLDDFPVNPNQKKYYGEILYCNEIEKRIFVIEEALKSNKIPLLDLIPEEQIEVPTMKEMSDINNISKKVMQEIEKVQATQRILKQKLFDAQQLREVLIRIGRYNQKTDSDAALAHAKNKIDSENLQVNVRLIVGLLNTDKIHVFERILWRLTHGLVVYFTEQVKAAFEDPITGDPIFKTFFIIFVQGNELFNKVKKLCHGYNAKIYEKPGTEKQCDELFRKTCSEIVDTKMVMRKSNELHLRTLNSVAKNLFSYRVQVLKAKSIFMTMNLLTADPSGASMIGEMWIPDYEIKRVRRMLAVVSNEVEAVFGPIFKEMPIDEEAPTHFKTNKFLEGFQALVEAYGIPNYKEANPSICTIVTFPFLFAVMFGDIGHGLIMALFGLWMVVKEIPLLKAGSRNEIWNIMFGGRYIILLCGLFSIYTGFIYNDIFSKSINIFGSAWKVIYDFNTVRFKEVLQLDPNSCSFPDGPYLFGIDPVWQLANPNKIIFQNAFKMKISIIFGVVHMLFGIILSCVNHIYFKNQLAIFTEFIPQIIFFSCIFLYLVALMFYKWIKYSPAEAACAPSLLITFINMVMFKKTEALPNCDPFLFPYQRIVQMILVAIALLCVPWMLLIKPFYIHMQRKKLNQLENVSHVATEEEEEEPISEIFIHQAIHTIEFVLGSVSHTASYLRLWALSLAHSQLAEVLWRMVLNIGIVAPGYFGGIQLWLIFCVWAVGTVAILVVMEGLSAFLHTLRLHWVESQSKFYLGQGIKFEPFTFKDISNKKL